MRKLSYNKTKSNDLIITDDVEPTESYAGVGDENILISEKFETKVDLSLAEYNKAGKVNKKKETIIENKIGDDLKLDFKHGDASSKTHDELHKSGRKSSHRSNSSTSVPSLPELKAKFNKLEPYLPPEKAQSINHQIEKLAHHKLMSSSLSNQNTSTNEKPLSNKISVADKLQQMKAMQMKSKQNWAQYKSEIEFVKIVEHQKENILSDELQLNNLLDNVSQFEMITNQNQPDKNNNQSDTGTNQNQLDINKNQSDTITNPIDTVIKPMRLKFPCNPITKDEALDLKQVLFSSPNRCFGSEWYRQNIEFYPIKSPSCYAIIQKQEGPNGIMSIIQGEILVQAMFHPIQPDGSTKKSTRQASWLYSFRNSRNDILANAMAEIISRCCGDSSTQYKICLWDRNLKDRKLGLIKEDGLIECLNIYQIENTDRLKQFLQHHINQFTDPFSPGLVLIVLSCIFTYGLSKIRDYNSRQNIRIIDPMGNPSIELFHLVLNGCFTGHVFNDTVAPSHQDSLGSTKDATFGISKRSSLGLLSLNRAPHCDLCREIGTYLKTPKYPVWLVPWYHRQYCVIFCENKCLTTDWKSEIRFQLHMYSPRFTLPRLVNCSIDSSSAAMEKHIERDKRIKSQQQLADKQLNQLKLKLRSMSQNALKLLLADDEDDDKVEGSEGQSDVTLGVDEMIERITARELKDQRDLVDEEETPSQYLERLLRSKWQNATIEIAVIDLANEAASNTEQHQPCRMRLMEDTWSRHSSRCSAGDITQPIDEHLMRLFKK